MPTQIVWPPGLPQKLQSEDYSRTMRDAVARFESEIGLEESRQRFSRPVYEIQGSQIITNSQVDILEDFYEDTLRNGTRQFEWTIPGTDKVAYFKFRRPYELSSEGAEYLVIYDFWMVKG